MIITYDTYTRSEILLTIAATPTTGALGGGGLAAFTHRGHGVLEQHTMRPLL